MRIFENNSLGSYHKFLLKYEKEYSIHLDNTEELFVEFISKKLASGKRIHELLMIKQLMEYETNALSRVKASLIVQLQPVVAFKHANSNFGAEAANRQVPVQS